MTSQMIPRETVAKILDTAQIAEVVGDFVSLRRRGANYVACCPFHNEKTPSFYVSPSKGIYKCFGCGKSGTAVGFVMEHEALSYGDALKYLARKYGIEVVEKEETAEEIAARQKGESLMLVSEFAHKFFVEALSGTEGRTIGYEYFRSRGLEDETIRKFALGWAPRDRNALFSAAVRAGYKEEYLIDSGLCIKYDDGRVADRFFDRVIFPVHSVSGRVIAFGGRTLRTDKTVAKYVNSPETEIYDKSSSLYGIWFAKGEMSRSDRCYLVEGYLDVLSMHQLGITNVVASSGTSLTVPQIRLIGKFTKNVTIMYDGDSAGVHAALRGIGLILKEGMNVKVVLLPDGDDPDSFARKHNLEEVQGFIADNSRDFISFKTDLLLEEAGGDPLKRADLINDIADTIALIPDQIKRTVYAQDCADKFNMDSQILHARIRKSREKMLLDERKAAERGRDAAYPSQDEVPQDSGQAAEQDVNKLVGADYPAAEVPMLAPIERDLVTELLRSGTTVLEFPQDSDFYSADSNVTVADFIRCCLEEDGFVLCNSEYKALYDAYFSLYDANPDFAQDRILRQLMDGEDRRIASRVSELSQEKYHLTVERLSASMTAEMTKLVSSIPLMIRIYQSKRIDWKRKCLDEELKQADSARSDEILTELDKLNRLKTNIMHLIGRVH